MEKKVSDWKRKSLFVLSVKNIQRDKYEEEKIHFCWCLKCVEFFHFSLHLTSRYSAYSLSILFLTHYDGERTTTI
jgi:hypothetical protein